MHGNVFFVFLVQYSVQYIIKYTVLLNCNILKVAPYNEKLASTGLYPNL